MALLTSAPEDLWRALPAALEGAAPLAVGFVPDDSHSVPDGTAVVIATSGSTGVPKRVILGANALRASAAATAKWIGEGQWLLALPDTYVAGLQVLVRSLLAGTEPVMLTERFTAASFARATAELDPRVAHYTSLVPAQLATIVEAAEQDAEMRAAASGYAAILVGGQATSPQLRERAAELGLRIVRTYGSTETSGGCVYDGFPLDGVSIRSVDGELQVSGAILADGYLGDPTGTANVFPVDGTGTRWYRTGDLGGFNDGVVSVTGRVDRVIISGGVNVSLDQVERVVRGCPGFEAAVVVGAVDERWGHTPVVVVRGSAQTETATLLADVRGRVGESLGVAARPREVKVVDALPQLPSGKADYAAIAALFD